jgi:hypothetical protein
VSGIGEFWGRLEGWGAADRPGEDKAAQAVVFGLLREIERKS